jgi:hypothetical protein
VLSKKKARLLSISNISFGILEYDLTLILDNIVVPYIYSAINIDSGYSEGILPVPIHISKFFSISIR